MSLCDSNKQIERQHCKGGFTRLIAAIPTLCMQATRESVRKAFRAVDSKATQLWLKASLGKTLTARRNAAYRESRKKTCVCREGVLRSGISGGAVAMNIDSGDTPLVLLCPAWKNWGTAAKLKPNSVILHSRQDDVVPFADSEELVANSDRPPETLIKVGSDLRLADPEPLTKMLDAREQLTGEY